MVCAADVHELSMPMFWFDETHSEHMQSPPENRSVVFLNGNENEAVSHELKLCMMTAKLSSIILASVLSLRQVEQQLWNGPWARELCVASIFAMEKP